MSEETKRLEDETTHRLPTEDELTQRISAEKAMAPSLTYLNEGAEVIDGRYIIEKLISSTGGEADIFLCHTNDRSQQKVVVKFYRLPDVKPKQNILEKIKGIDHPDIVKLLDYGTWEGRFFEVMEYAEGGSLTDKMPFSEQELTNRVIPEIINALQFIHDRGIIHRDLKPSNLFYRDKKQKDIVLGDFGISSIVEDSEVTSILTSRHRTTAYTAPEIFAGIVSRTGEADYYSLGITLIHLLTGTNPFIAMAEARIMAIHTSEEVPLPDCSDRFKTLLRGLLVKERKKRWGHKEIKRWLNGEEVPVYKDDLSLFRRTIPPFKYKPGVEAKSMEQLAQLMLEDRQTAMKHVGQGTISTWLKPFEQTIAVEIGEVERKATNLEAAVVEVIYILDPDQPYRLMADRSAKTPEQLARLIDSDSQTWQAGKNQLFGEQILAWLKRTGYQQLVGQWNKLDMLHKRDQDEGLEAFLHILDPALGRPLLDLNRTKLNFGRMKPGSSKTLSLKISNKGRGYLTGSLSLEKDVGGIEKFDHTFKGKRGEKTEIKFTVNTGGLKPGQKRRTNLILSSNAQRSELTIPFTYRVAFPILGTLGTCLRSSIPGILIPLIYQLAYNYFTRQPLPNLAPAIPLVVLGVLFFGGFIGLWKSANKYRVGYIKLVALPFLLLFLAGVYLNFLTVHKLPEINLGETPNQIKQKISQVWLSIFGPSSTKGKSDGETQYDGYTGIITAPLGASVRRAPDKDSPRVGTVQHNQQVKVLGKAPYWFKIQFGPRGQVGYIYEELISVPGWGDKITQTRQAQQSQMIESDTEQQIEYSIIFDSNPPGATVFINDRRIGETPFMTKSNAATIAIRLELEGYQTHSEQVTLKSGGINKLKFDLTPKN